LDEEFNTAAASILQAFLKRDSEAVSAIFKNFFASLTFHQRPEGEKTFHAYIQLILSAMGFNLLPEVPGAIGCQDLTVELPGKVYVIIELKYSPAEKKQPKKKSYTEKENALLASFAYEWLPTEVVDENLALLARTELGNKEIRKILSDSSQNKSSNAEKNQILAQAALDSLSEADINQALVLTVIKKLPRDEIETKLSEAGVEIDLPPENLDLSSGQIDKILSRLAEAALRAIVEKDYHGPFRLQAKEFIDVGLAVYGYGNHLKAAFGPK
jgi:hypothetical protein